MNWRLVREVVIDRLERRLLLLWRRGRVSTTNGMMAEAVWMAARACGMNVTFHGDGCVWVVERVDGELYGEAPALGTPGLVERTLEIVRSAHCNTEAERLQLEGVES